MERQNRPRPLTLPSPQTPSFLSSLAYHSTVSAGPLPAWSTNRRHRATIRRTFVSLSNSAAIILIALVVIIGTLTWFLVRSVTTAATSTSSPLSQIPDGHPPIQITVPHLNTDPAQVDIPSSGRRLHEANSTLNFERIFAINLPSRLDRKDLLTVMAKYTDLSITIVPGVSTIADSAIPPPRMPGSLRIEEYRVWRAHANVWRRVVEDGLSTALVLEDDNDWDVNLKEQIPRILTALEEIRLMPRRLDEGEGVVRGGPRVEEWDILYLGTCFEMATLSDKQGRQTVVPIPSDGENVASHNYNWVEEILTRHGQNDPPTRILQRASLAQCTHAYAVTARGARKLLYYTSLHLDKRLDMAIADLVQSDLLAAFSVIPPIMIQWKTTERADKDTDVGYDVWPVHNWGFKQSVRYQLRKDNEVGWDKDVEWTDSEI